MIKSRRRQHRLLGKASRLRRRISIERRTFNIAAARPESRADHLMRIGLAGDGIGARAFWSAPPRETRHTEVETSPEEMYRTVLADEAGAKFLEDVLAQDQYLPEAVRILGVIGGVLRVAFETHRVRHFAGHAPDFHRNAQRTQGRHEFSIEVGDRLRLQCLSLR